MPITAETFGPEHFEKVVRGVQVACEAYGRIAEAFEEAERDGSRRDAEIEALKDALAEKPTQREWDQLVELIEDVERGVRTPDELFTYVREHA